MRALSMTVPRLALLVSSSGDSAVTDHLLRSGRRRRAATLMVGGLADLEPHVQCACTSGTRAARRSSCRSRGGGTGRCSCPRRSSTAVAISLVSDVCSVTVAPGSARLARVERPGLERWRGIPGRRRRRPWPAAARPPTGRQTTSFSFSASSQRSCRCGKPDVKRRWLPNAFSLRRGGYTTDLEAFQAGSRDLWLPAKSLKVLG